MMSFLRFTGFAEHTPKGAHTPMLTEEALKERPLPKKVPNNGLPSTTVVATNDVTPTATRPDLTVLQQHVLFFDRDADGVIYPVDTFVGFRKIGMEWILSIIAVFLIHSTFSYPTGASWIPSLRFPVCINRMHRTKHGSDSGTFDTEGRFVGSRFEEIFSKWAKDGKLGWDEINTMLYDTRSINDPIGWVATRSEWWVLWWLAKDDKGYLTKERVRLMFNGALWPVLEEECNKKRGYALYPVVPLPGAKTSANGDKAEGKKADGGDKKADGGGDAKKHGSHEMKPAGAQPHATSNDNKREA